MTGVGRNLEAPRAANLPAGLERHIEMRDAGPCHQVGKGHRPTCRCSDYSEGHGERSEG